MSRSEAQATQGMQPTSLWAPGSIREPPNKRMQLTKLTAAPVLRAEVPPCAPAGETDGRTASQLIRGVRPTTEEGRWEGIPTGT